MVVCFNESLLELFSAWAIGAAVLSLSWLFRRFVQLIAGVDDEDADTVKRLAILG
jgi:hypothetical protein